ncbi:hypothetical protein IM774_12580 [Erysipelotrichaceae bacterium RD49]|nr:hypothetical protein [Erysipelotrichaceae bacterium RD49]
MPVCIFSVPINSQGIEDLENQEDSFYIHDYEMPEDQIQAMISAGLFEKINTECNLDLQLGKVSQIPFEKADAVMRVLKKTAYENSEFAAALIDAQYFMTWVDCVL